MYQKILIPLDGSKLAECVLPHVEAVTKGCQVTDVVFVRVVEPVHLRAVGEYVLSDEDQKRMESESKSAAEDYLNQLMSRLKYEGVRLQSEVIVGKAADSIADYAEKNDIDLIIIATHGRSGISRWVWGSIADRILRSSCVPVLMVRAPGCISGI